ncbi:FUSC family protein [Nocardioides jiangxiensis]|uniref:FUSC family protein n=1 Tax=Nocardioides jiangxiensis TaxID=3064524 RepID=A0ABT9AXW9_9ACTN|nr:FUSC family protein [Nocardioides sp. WY-20]MDO7867232.1 FUSC family protein [Nocardioides sp. WY-20]
MPGHLDVAAARRRAMADWAHAARVSLGLVLPGAALVLADRPELIIYAVFGSFAGMYGRAESRTLRLLHQSQGALLLLTGTVIGVALAHADADRPTIIVAAACFAVVGSLVADFFSLRPEGPFYGIFALGALAGMPELASPLALTTIAVASAVLAVLIGLASGRSGDAVRALVETVRAQRLRSRPGAVVHAFRYAVAVAAAGSAALACGLTHVNWAIAGAAVTLAAADSRGRLLRGIHRVVGTIAGLAVTALALAPGFSPRTLAIVVICLLFPTELFMAVNYALALSFFTPMIMLMTELAQPIGMRELLEDRALGTMLGVVVALVVSWVLRDATSWTSTPVPSREQPKPPSSLA